ncbi:MAG: hypothetical protein WD871_08305 [Xanthobacteraceae bacterium]
MGILDWFKRPPPIADSAALVDFLDSHAAFMVQKGIFDYTRAIAGPSFSLLIRESVFAAAVDAARWKNYPLALSMVAEMVDGVLRPFASSKEELGSALTRTALDVFDGYAVPAALGAEAWSAARLDLETRLKRITLHATKFAKDIPLPLAEAVFNGMPIHERLRGNHIEWVRNSLRSNLIRMHEEFSERADCAALVAMLGVASPARAPQPTA